MHLTSWPINQMEQLTCVELVAVANPSGSRRCPVALHVSLMWEPH